MRPPQLDSIYAAFFDPSTSTGSIEGGDENNSGALAINACPIGPLRCFWRPFSSVKVSNTPKVLCESLNAYQLIVVGSFLAMSRATSRNFATSSSLPGLASNRATKASLIIKSLHDWLLGLASKSEALVQNTRAGATDPLSRMTSLILIWPSGLSLNIAMQIDVLTVNGVFDTGLATVLDAF